MFPKTPNIEDSDIEKILDALNAEFIPVELKVEYNKNSIVNDCYNNVQKQISSKGGKRVLGWQLWKSDFILEAQCHPVWEDKKNRLHDITPKENAARTILFVEDDGIVYNDQQIENVRINISNNELVDHYIETFRAKFRFENTGKRKNLYDFDFLESLSDFERQQHMALHKTQAKLELMMIRGQGMDSNCFCGSNEAYKDCHGLNFLEMMKNY